MSPERLAEIEARLKAATPGPWFHDMQFMQVAAEDPSGGSCLYIGAEGGPTDPDAALIANAPTDLADLLAEVRALSAERDALSADFDTKIAHFSDELNHARARVAELEEAARWRPETEQ